MRPGGGRVQGTLGTARASARSRRRRPAIVFAPTADTTSRRRRRLHWLVNLDARLSLADYGLEKSYLQFNIYNLFDQFYVGGFSGLNQTITRISGITLTLRRRRSAHDQGSVVGF